MSRPTSPTLPAPPPRSLRAEPSPETREALDPVAAAAALLGDAPGPDPDEEAWMAAADGRLLRHFRQALYGQYADLDEPDETTGVRPSKTDWR